MESNQLVSSLKKQLHRMISEDFDTATSKLKEALTQVDTSDYSSIKLLSLLLSQVFLSQRNYDTAASTLIQIIPLDNDGDIIESLVDLANKANMGLKSSIYDAIEPILNQKNFNFSENLVEGVQEL